METTVNISLYSHFYLKLAKMLFFLLSLMLSLQQNREQEGRISSAQKLGGGGPCK
jgi:hypothetical protein